MARWTQVTHPYRLEHARNFIASRRPAWESGQCLSFAIERGGEFCGSVDLRPGPVGAAEIGYSLAPWARGRGTMAAALRLALRWGFDELDLQAVHWKAIVGNWRSRRVAWAVGFRIDGISRASIDDHGRLRDAWTGSLLRGEPLSPAHPWLTPPVLTDGAVVLRQHLADDIPRIVQACTDPLTQYWLPDLPHPYGRLEAAAHLEQIAGEHATGNGLFWAVCDPGEGHLLGEVGLFGMRGGVSAVAEAGYWAHPDARGRGLTVRALRLATRHAFIPREDGGLGLSRLLVRVARGNEASAHVAVAAGMRATGVDRSAEKLRDGSVHDFLRFDLLARECRDPAADGRAGALGRVAMARVRRNTRPRR